jgi:predicted peptidase
MHWRHAVILAGCIAATGCASRTPRHEIINSGTPVAKEVAASVQPTAFDAADFNASDGTMLRYRVLLPSRILPGRTYPLVLQLHGSGGIGSDNAKQLDRLARTWATPELRERYQAYILVPQFQIRSANYGPASADQHAEPSAALSAALELVEQFISRHAVDTSRIYAVGFSMGGSATWLAPTLRPRLFAAVVPISGIAPEDSFAPVFKGLPTLVIHGNADTENPLIADRRFADEVARIGGRKLRFREYEGLDHRLPADIFPGRWWRDWLFRQSRR